MAKRIAALYSTSVQLSDAPINPDFIVEGAPVARAHLLVRGTFGLTRTVIWDCTAGKFNWVYDFDETCYFTEGEAIIDDGVNGPRKITPGDVAFFPKGSTANWHVENYIKKIAFCQPVMPDFAGRALGVLRFLNGLRKPAGEPKPAF